MSWFKIMVIVWLEWPLEIISTSLDEHGILISTFSLFQEKPSSISGFASNIALLQTHGIASNSSLEDDIKVENSIWREMPVSDQTIQLRAIVFAGIDL